VVTLVGRSTNSLPFTAIILNSESNIPIKNGVMHVIRGIIIFCYLTNKKKTFDFRYSIWNNYFTWRCSFISTRSKVTTTIFYFLQILSIIFSAFTQLLQQTGIINQLKQSGRPHTLFIPTNAALQSVGMTQDVNRLRQVKILFVHKSQKIIVFLFYFNSLFYVIYVLMFFLIQRVIYYVVQLAFIIVVKMSDKNNNNNNNVLVKNDKIGWILNKI
jgi:hypothetical protein